MKQAKTAALLSAAMILGACAADHADRQAALSAPDSTPEPEAEEPADLSGPGLPLPMALPAAAAREPLENVAAACWLDDIIGGGSMIVDRDTGRIIITSDTEDLLIAEILSAGADSSIARVTGPAAEDPAIALRLSETLDATIAAGHADCATGA